MRISCSLSLILSWMTCSSTNVSLVEAFQQSKIWQIKKEYPSNVPSIRSSSCSLFQLFVVNNNIVLRPSIEDDDAFDNLKIGGCRVHRYKRENDPDSETEYVMWYHGRSKELDGDKTLPPLSTGRIGRATSKNGLSWQKDTIGSASEDVQGVSVGLNTDSWWGFDTAHVGLGSVLLPMSTPAVLTEGGVYLMYYMGGSFEETPIGDYVDREVPQDAKIKGMKMKIGVCVSQDGKTWGRVEGDDPSGACVVPFDTRDPNSAQKARDDASSITDLTEELYTGWPEVVVNIDDSRAGNSGFLMYYSTMTKKDKVKSIGLAESPDGFRWLKRGICLEPDEGTLDEGGVARCNVVRNAVYDNASRSWVNTRGYTMYYEGVSKKDNKHRILIAESSDGKRWKKNGVVLDVGVEGAWDSDGVGSPHILRMDDGSLRMYYTGQGSDGSTAIGVAKLEIGSTEWAREQASIVFSES